MNTFHQDFDEVTPPRIGERDLRPRDAHADRIQNRVADKLRQTAETLFGKTEDAAPLHGASDIKARAGSWLSQSADYIEQMEPEKLKTDISNQVRRNPGKSLLVAGAAGLILGAIFRRR